MIPLPRGWRTTTIDGGLGLAHPRGADVASIVYRDRQRPLEPIARMVDRLAGTADGFEVFAVGMIERLVTDEGEHGALLTIRGHRDGAPLQRDLGFVIADDFYAFVSGACHDPEIGEEMTTLVRELVRADVQALGVRRRRYEYRPPRAWQPLVVGLATEWIAPAFPAARTSMTMYGATPLALAQAHSHTIGVMDLQGYAIEVAEPARELVADGGLHGEWGVLRATRAGEPPISRCVVALADSRFSYVAEMTSVDPSEARWESECAVFRAVARSISAIPSPVEAPSKRSELFYLAD